MKSFNELNDENMQQYCRFQNAIATYYDFLYNFRSLSPEQIQEILIEIVGQASLQLMPHLEDSG